MLRMVQLNHPEDGRRIAIVEEPMLRVLDRQTSIYEAAHAALAAGQSLEQLLNGNISGMQLDYEAIYRGESDWKLLPAFDHPIEPARCFVTGTGLTHKASAENRQSMHGDPTGLTDSMKMYRIGLEGGRPTAGTIGAAPEWFYKGTGQILKAHGQALNVPWHADDGGDEAEVAGCYIVAPDGTPVRVGLAQGNEFSDHILEAKNYLYLAQSKLRECSLGPELIVGSSFDDVPGEARIERAGKVVWNGPLASGQRWMCHTLSNLEHHHFKHETHRRSGDAHVHFLGADLFSFKDRLHLEDRDEMVIVFQGFGRPLRNPIRIAPKSARLTNIKVL